MPAVLLAGYPKERELHDVASGFKRVTSRPGIDRMIKPPPLPPIGIVTSQMQCRLKPASAPRVVMNYASGKIVVQPHDTEVINLLAVYIVARYNMVCLSL